MDELGMDTMTAGGNIAFAMELQEKGLWDCGLHFGQTDTLSQVFEDIAYRRGIGDILAEGTKRMAEKFGGRTSPSTSRASNWPLMNRAARSARALAMPRPTGAVAILTPATWCLWKAWGTRTPTPPEPRRPDGDEPESHGSHFGRRMLLLAFPLFSFYPGWLIAHYDHPVAKIAFATLPFSGGIVNLLNKLPGKLLPLQLPGFPYPKALSAVTGLKINVGTMKDIGERGYNLERLLNIRMGLKGEEDTLPKRLTDDLQIENDPRTRVPIDKLKAAYYKIRGWDSAGIPTSRKKKALGLR